MTSYCQYTPDKKEQSTQNQTKICAIIVFYVYFVLYIELLFGDVGLNGSLKGVINTKNFEVTDKTILEYILSTHSFIGSQTFTATCADKPPNNAEYNIFWFGSNMRITVLALEYAFNTSKLYRREIFGNEWLSVWIEL